MLDDHRSHFPTDSTDPRDAIDSETACLLRSFMVPAIDAALNWSDLNSALERKGFAVGFRDGRLIFKRLEDGQEVCTGRVLGTPLRDLVKKLGRPCVRAHSDGHTGSLMV